MTAMIQRLRPHLPALCIGILYWLAFAALSGVAEPWDANGAYWVVGYPLSLVLSGLVAFRFGGGGWAGFWITFAQLPVMAFRTEMGPLLAVGIAFLIALSVPAIAVAMLAGRFRRRARPAGRW